MAIMVNNQGGDTESWCAAIRGLIPQIPVYAYPGVPNKADIHYAVVWHHPHADLLSYENLKSVLLLGAGTDHIDQAPSLPDVPIVRLIDPAVGNDMAQYVLYWLMHFQRGYETYRQQQVVKHWQRHIYPLAVDYQVTILGAGLIAEFIAKRIALNGFKVRVWSRSSRQDSEAFTYHSGDDGLRDALVGTRVLVNCLPLKPQTRHFINEDVLSTISKGAFFINVSRGGVVDDRALLSALDKGHVAGAALDTFAAEPLPENDPYWEHPKVHITPHMSGATYTRTAAKVIADNILRVERGEAPFPVYVREKRR